MKGPWLEAVTPLPGTTAAALAWRWRGQLQITVVAKATFAFVPDGPMVRVAPERIVSADVHHRDNPSLSIRLTSDLVPRLDRTDVLFTGCAHAPPEGPRSAVPVRLGIFDGQRALLDKRLLCRDKAAFERMSIVYERAVGGIGAPENPVGVGWNDANIVDPSQPQRTVGLGPIARAWPARRRLLGATPRKALDGPVLELPDGFDWSYFQAAPIDQQIEPLRGDEWIILEGMSPTAPLLRTRLPGARGHAWIHGLAASGIAAGQRLELRADTLGIDGDAQRCTVVWRLHFPVRDEAALAAVRLVVTTTVAGEDAGDGRLPAGSEKKTQVLEAAPSAPSTETLVLQPEPSASPAGTLVLQAEPGPPARPALPFSGSVQQTAPAPHAGAPSPRRVEPAPGSTLSLTGSPAVASPALPFRSAAAARPAAPPQATSVQEDEERSAAPTRMPGLPAPPAMLGPLAAVGPAPAPLPPAAPAAVPPAVTAPAPPSAPAPEPPVELSIEQLAAITAAIAERRDPRAKVLDRHGLDEAGLAANRRRWTEKIDREASRGQSKLRSAHDVAYLAAVEGFRGPITVSDYARIVVALERGTADDALDALSIQRPALMSIVRVWTRKVAADPRLSDEARARFASLRAPVDSEA